MNNKPETPNFIFGSKMISEIFGGKELDYDRLKSMTKEEKEALVNFLSYNISKREDSVLPKSPTYVRLYKLYCDFLPLLIQFVPGVKNIDLIPKIEVVHRDFINGGNLNSKEN